MSVDALRLVAAGCAAAAVYLWAAPVTTTPRRRLVRQPRVPLSRWLAQAGCPVSAGQFVAVSLGLGAVLFIAVWQVSGVAAAAVVPAVVGALAPRAFYGYQREQRARAVLQAWPDALRDLVSLLRSHHTLEQALSALGTAGPVPLQPAWRRFGEVAHTTDVATGLEAVRRALGDVVSDRVIEVLAVAHSHGGELILELLEGLAERTTEEVAVAEEAESANLQHRIDAWASGLLPFVLLVWLCASFAPFRDFYARPEGFAWVVLFAVMSAAGAMWVRRLRRLPNEQRVFTGPSVNKQGVAPAARRDR